MLRAANPPIDEMRQILADICKDSLRVSEVIQGIRALTRKRDPDRRLIDINQTVESALRLVSGDALRRGAQISRHLAADLPLVHADAPSIQQVLLNLIVNAMDAMSDTPQRVRQIAVATEHGRGSVIVSVADRGHGISADGMSRLFESFFTTKRDGVGLGLSISRSIVQSHGGSIWAENNARGGSTFYFTLRAPEATPIPVQALREPDLQRGASLSR
jgi:C4-dicarboxylate-specific signal transduction histidine kinase